MDAVALIVIEVEIFSKLMPSKSRIMSSMESMATPTFPTSPMASGFGIEPNLSRQVEGDAQSGSAIAQQVLVAAVRFFGIAHAGVLPHGPQPPAVHGGLHTAGIGELPRVAEIAVVIPTFEVSRSVKRMNADVRGSFLLGRQLGSHRPFMFAFGHKSRTSVSSFKFSS